MRHPLWREDGFVIYSYNCFCALPEQSFWSPSPAELTTIIHCLFLYNPNLQGEVPVFLSPRNRVAQLYPRALGSLFVASYSSQGCGGGILTRLHTSKCSFLHKQEADQIGSITSPIPVSVIERISEENMKRVNSDVSSKSSDCLFASVNCECAKWCWTQCAGHKSPLRKTFWKKDE
jgi:hypothetical protein